MLYSIKYPLVRSIWCSDHWRPPPPPPECVETTSAMSFGGALIEIPRNATTTITVQNRSHEWLLWIFCQWFSREIDCGVTGVFYVKRRFLQNFTTSQKVLVVVREFAVLVAAVE
jgi:hypothetical protein